MRGEVQEDILGAAAHAYDTQAGNLGEELRQALGQERARVVDVVAEDVQFAARGRDVVDGGDLNGRDDANSGAFAGHERLRDAAYRVVV